VQTPHYPPRIVFSVFCMRVSRAIRHSVSRHREVSLSWVERCKLAPLPGMTLAARVWKIQRFICIFRKQHMKNVRSLYSRLQYNSDRKVRLAKVFDSVVCRPSCVAIAPNSPSYLRSLNRNNMRIVTARRLRQPTYCDSPRHLPAYRTWWAPAARTPGRP
jgi:hypothetical protein